MQPSRFLWYFLFTWVYALHLLPSLPSFSIYCSKEMDTCPIPMSIARKSCCENHTTVLAWTPDHLAVGEHFPCKTFPRSAPGASSASFFPGAEMQHHDSGYCTHRRNCYGVELLYPSGSLCAVVTLSCHRRSAHLHGATKPAFDYEIDVWSTTIWPISKNQDVGRIRNSFSTELRSASEMGASFCWHYLCHK